MSDTHPTFSLAPAAERLQALYRGHMIASSDHAVLVRQEGKEPAIYFPREDVMMSVLNPIDFSTEGPLGRATYFTILRDGQFTERGAWTFERPSEAGIDLSGMIAFDPQAVKIEGSGDRTEPMWTDEQRRQMGDYIRHTDSGSGGSQAEPWAPTVTQPSAEGGGVV